MIGFHGLANGRKCLAMPTHEKERDTFPRGPADRLAGDRGIVSGQDDRAEAMNAGRVQRLGAVRLANAQRASPDLKSGAVSGKKEEGFQRVVQNEKRVLQQLLKYSQ
jgi:hypothetical protein